METTKIEVNKDKAAELIAFRFVAQAIQKKDTGRFGNGCIFKYISIEPNYIAAVDGYHLHVARLPDHKYALGLYEIVKSNQKAVVLLGAEIEQSQFPKWQEVVPCHKQFFVLRHSWPDRRPETALGILGKYNISVPYNSLKALCITDIDWRVFFGDWNRPVFCATKLSETVQLEATIMPINKELNKIEIQQAKEGVENDS